MTRRGLIVAALAACVAVAAVMIARTWSNGMNSVDVAAVRWPYAALAAGCLAVFALHYAFCWWLLLSALLGRAAGRTVPLIPTMTLFLLSWPGRYVPASIPHYGGRLVAAPRIGVPRSTVAASLVYENLFVIAASGSVSLACLAIGFRERLGAGPWIALAVAGVAAAIVALQPWTMRAVLAVAAGRIDRLRRLDEHILPSGAVVRCALAYGLGVLPAGFAFYFAARAVSADGISLPLAIAAYNLAGVAGMLAVAVPGGIGVREGVVVALLAGVASPPVAIAAAVVARLAGIVADLVPAMVIVVARGVRHATHRKPIALEARPLR